MDSQPEYIDLMLSSFFSTQNADGNNTSEQAALVMLNTTPAENIADVVVENINQAVRQLRDEYRSNSNLSRELIGNEVVRNVDPTSTELITCSVSNVEELNEILNIYEPEIAQSPELTEMQTKVKFMLNTTSRIWATDLLSSIIKYGENNSVDPEKLNALRERLNSNLPKVHQGITRSLTESLPLFEDDWNESVADSFKFEMVDFPAVRLELVEEYAKYSETEFPSQEFLDKLASLIVRSQAVFYTKLELKLKNQ